jgi:hypothetical protein
MADKFLKFSVVETTGRTFEIPMSKVKELLKKSDEDTSSWNEVDMADFLYNTYEIQDNILKYEKDNSCYESYIQDEEIE